MKFNDAVSMDAVEGLNVIVTVQLPPATTEFRVEQVAEVIVKSPGFDPGRPMAGATVKLSARFPVFIRVTVWDALVTPCWTEPNGTLAGRLTIGWPP